MVVFVEMLGISLQVFDVNGWCGWVGGNVCRIDNDCVQWIGELYVVIGCFVVDIFYFGVVGCFYCV